MAHLSDRQKADLVRQHLDGVPWTRIAEHSGVTVRTLQRWAEGSPPPHWCSPAFRSLSRSRRCLCESPDSRLVREVRSGRDGQ